jgi:hypothetical protein
MEIILKNRIMHYKLTHNAHFVCSATNATYVTSVLDYFWFNVRCVGPLKMKIVKKKE